jgi:hypothetical protein
MSLFNELEVGEQQDGGTATHESCSSVDDAFFRNHGLESLPSALRFRAERTSS